MTVEAMPVLPNNSLLQYLVSFGNILSFQLAYKLIVERPGGELEPLYKKFKRAVTHIKNRITDILKVKRLPTAGIAIPALKVPSD